MGRLWVIIRKIFSVSLVFNALLTIGCISGILAGFYWYYYNWHPFSPYLISGNLFWIAIAAAIINIFPSAGLGRSLHTGRFLFHHYFYGFMVIVCAVVYIVFFTQISLLTIFLVNNTSVQVNVVRFFILGGITLILDDLPDVHNKLDSGLNWLKCKVGKGAWFISAIQLVMGAVSLYVFSAVILSVFSTPEYVTVANLMLLGTLFITSVTSFIFVRRKVWYKIGD